MPRVDCRLNPGKNYINMVNKKNGNYFKGKVDAPLFCVFESVGQSVSVHKAFKTHVLPRTLQDKSTKFGHNLQEVWLKWRQFISTALPVSCSLLSGHMIIYGLHYL